ncbi:MAG: hypothetical protein IPK03_07690 [Bacteroidetes bacterium]|nr:hypothetical protein [Bacteroidota bacterium]
MNEKAIDINKRECALLKSEEGDNLQNNDNQKLVIEIAIENISLSSTIIEIQDTTKCDSFFFSPIQFKI